MKPALYVRPIVDTYHGLGIAAEHRPINDIHVRGRKIGGTGAARIGPADVVVGSPMFDFDVDIMTRVLRVPSEKFRDKVHQSLRDYMTTMRRELGQPPPRDEVVARYVAACAAVLGRRVEAGALTPAEVAMAEALDARFAEHEWLYAIGGLRRRGVKVHEDVHVGAQGARGADPGNGPASSTADCRHLAHRRLQRAALELRRRRRARALRPGAGRVVHPPVRGTVVRGGAAPVALRRGW